MILLGVPPCTIRTKIGKQFRTTKCKGEFKQRYFMNSKYSTTNECFIYGLKKVGSAGVSTPPFENRLRTNFVNIKILNIQGGPLLPDTS